MRWLTGLGLGCLAAAALAQPAQPVPSGAEAIADPVAWLAKVQSAALNRNYQGTVAYSAGAVVSSMRVAHFVEGSQRYERIEPQDGQARQVLRHNDVVKTLWPQVKLAVVEPREAVAAFPALPGGDTNPAQVYELRALATERVAGHEAQIVQFKPRDNLRYGQRLWVERSSGLLLRADIVGPQGEMIESTAFTDLQLLGRAQPEVVLVPMKKAESWRVIRPAVDRAQLEAEGWSVGKGVAGFVLLGCVKRTLNPASPAEGQVMQAVFSDGLTHVSVFIEPFDAKRHKAMRTALGATQTLTQREGDWWFTVVGDVPQATVDQFAKALVRKR